MKYKRYLGFISCFLMMGSTIVAGCGSGSGNTQSEEAVSVNSLSSLPGVDEMLSVASGSSSSLSARRSMSLSSMRSNVVSGTPPALSEINQSNSDTYFWNGLVAQINLYASSNGSEGQDPASAIVRESFWEGEGSCRMASNVAQSLGNIAQVSTSTCYMSNAPQALGLDSVISGDVSDPSEVMSQTESNKLVKVVISNNPGGGGEQNVFIRVYGTSSTEGSVGYAADLVFCDPSEGGAPNSFEQLRVNNSTGSMTVLSVGSSESENNSGTHVVQFTGALTANSSGEIVFDPNVAQVANVYFDGSYGTFKGYMSVEGTELNSKNTYVNEYQGSTYTHKVVSVGNISSNSTGDALFLEAGFGVDWSDSNGFTTTFYGGTEFQDTHYVAVNSGALYDEISGFNFSTDTFFSAPIDEAASLVSQISNYSCSETPDIIIAMDMSSPEIQAVSDLCEVQWTTDNLCNTSDIESARAAIMAAQQQ